MGWVDSFVNEHNCRDLGCRMHEWDVPASNTQGSLVSSRQTCGDETETQRTVIQKDVRAVFASMHENVITVLEEAGATFRSSFFLFTYTP